MTRTHAGGGGANTHQKGLVAGRGRRAAGRQGPSGGSRRLPAASDECTSHDCIDDGSNASMGAAAAADRRSADQQRAASKVSGAAAADVHGGYVRRSEFMDRVI